jgi:hypothetical protein
MFRKSLFNASRVVPAALMAAVLAACGETSPTAVTLDPSLLLGDTEAVPQETTPGVVYACAFGDGSSFTSYYSSTATGGDLWNAPTGEFTLTVPPDCREIWNSTSGDAETVSVTLTSAPGFALERIAVLYGGVIAPEVVFGSNTASATVSATQGAMMWFKLNLEDTPPPDGGEGCTPGYWKQSQHFDSWTGYTPDQLFSSVFENAFPGKTLLEVVSLGGGGLNALGRHTVAALLNGSSFGVDYDYTSAEIITLFNNVYPGTKASYENLKNRLDFLNNQGCGLN